MFTQVGSISKNFDQFFFFYPTCFFRAAQFNKIEKNPSILAFVPFPIYTLFLLFQTHTKNFYRLKEDEEIFAFFPLEKWIYFDYNWLDKICCYM